MARKITNAACIAMTVSAVNLGFSEHDEARRGAALIHQEIFDNADAPTNDDFLNRQEFEDYIRRLVIASGADQS